MKWQLTERRKKRERVVGKEEKKGERQGHERGTGSRGENNEAAMV